MPSMNLASPFILNKDAIHAHRLHRTAKQGQLLPESKVMTWFVQTALGLHYMHTNRVLHRDIKTQNVFILSSGRVVLGDLGISKVGRELPLCFAQSSCCPCRCLRKPFFTCPACVLHLGAEGLCTASQQPRRRYVVSATWVS